MKRFLFGLVALFLVGCAASNHFKIRVGAYAAEQDLCVAESSTRAESQACRKEIKELYAPLLAAKDAGHE